MVKAYLERCNVGKQEQKRDSLSRSFLTVGNDGVGLGWVVETLSLIWQGWIE
ncbi:Sulfurtransferase TusD homolog (fragment) [Vibrio coralliirubri]